MSPAKGNLLLCFFLAVIFLCPKVQAQNILVVKKTETFKLDKFLGVMVDKEHSLIINRVASPEMQSKFIYPEQESPNFGFSNSVYWLRFQVYDSVNSSASWILINHFLSLEDIRCYFKNDSGSFTEARSGEVVPVKKREFKGIRFVARLPMMQNKLNTFYLRVASGSPVIFSFSLLTEQEYFNSNTERLFFYGIIFGILFIIITYNTFLYFSVKDGSYIYYVLYVLSYAVFLFMQEGYYSYFIGSIFPRDYFAFMMVAITSLGLFCLLFTRDFLSTQKYLPQAYRLLNILAFAAGGIIVISFFIPLSIAVNLFSIGDVSSFIIAIVISVLALKKGNRLAKFYLLALSGTAIGIIALVFRDVKLLPVNFWSNNAINFGVLWEAIILSYSLGYRMSDLEKRVKERTSELTNRTEELKNLSEYLQNVREEERKYIATEIHDEFGGALSALKMDMFSVRDKIQIDDGTAAKYSSMISLVDNTIKKVQKISTELRPEILDDLGLAEAIEWYAEEFQKRTGIKCSVEIDLPEVEINPDLTVSLFRIYQETLTNIMRHSGAKKTCIKLNHSDGMLSLSVEDNGRGISEEEVSSTKSLGLIGMRERIKKWNGSFAVSKKGGGGTVVEIEVPMPK